MADILFEHVTKAFDEDQGLFGFSVTIEQGQAFGMLGPGGAGKSTAVSLLAGLIKPDEGQVRIRGKDPFTKRHQLMNHIGFVPGNARLPRGTTGEAFLRLMADARGGVSRKRMQELLEQLD